MNQDKLKDLLKHPVDSFERQPACPDDYRLASYMDGGLSERDHHTFETHLADCSFCMERIGILGRARESETSGSVLKPVNALANKRPNWQRPRWATAALLVLAVGFFTDQLSTSRTPASSDKFAKPSAVNERYVKPSSAIPEITFPLENSAVAREDLDFEWKLVPDGLFYDIRIVSDDGELITQQRVWDTHWSLPANFTLHPGAEYFVRVDAFVSEGKAISSEHIAFRIEDRQ